MSISTILDTSEKEMSDEQKLKAIITIVSSARKAYGNTDMEIDAPYVATVNGNMNLKYLSNSSKLQEVRTVITDMKMHVMEAEESVQGVVVNKVIEEMIATSPVLVNISDTTEFSYI